MIPTLLSKAAVELSVALTFLSPRGPSSYDGITLGLKFQLRERFY